MYSRNARDGRDDSGLIASGHSFEEILRAYSCLEEEDLCESLRYAAWRVEEIEVPLAVRKFN